MNADHIQQALPFFKKSVEERESLEFTYQGHLRKVCPHMLGITKDGRVVLHAYQYGGSGSKGEIQNPEEGAWRFFYMDEMPDGGSKSKGPWYPPKLAKVEAGEEYKPPKFIAEVLALTPKE